MESLSAFATRAASTVPADPALSQAYIARLERELSQLREAMTPFGLVQFDAETGRFISANDAFCALVGYTEAELLRRTTADIIRKSDSDAPGTGPVFQDRRLITQDGRLVWVAMATTFLRDPADRLVGTAIVQNNTECKQALAHAAEANRALSAVLEASTQGILGLDASGRITLVNFAAERMFGYSREELTGRQVESLLPESPLREPRSSPMSASESTGRRKDGSEFPAEITLSHHSGEYGPAATVFVTDITARKAAAENEARFKMAMDASGAGAWSWDARTNQAQWDERHQKMYGLAPDPPPSFEAWVARLHPEDRAHVLARIEEVRRTPGDDRWDMEFRAVQPDGRVVWMQGLGRAERDAAGQVVRLTGINLDITKRKTAQTAVDEARDRFSAILNASSMVGIVATDLDGTVRVFNSGAENQLGYRAEEVIGRKTPLDFMLASEAEKRGRQIRTETGQPVEGFAAMVESARRGGSDVREWTSVRKDGTSFPARVALTGVRDRDGKLTGFLGVCTDETERKQQEQALRESEEQFRAMFETSSVGMSQAVDGRFTRVNRRFCEMTGYNEAELIGRPIFDLTYPEDRERDRQAFSEAIIRGASEYHTEKRYVHKDGHVFWVDLTANMVRDAAGRPLRATAVVYDITARRKAEEALREAQQKQAFLLQLGDRLRHLSDARLIISAAVEMLGTHLHTGRVGYCEVDEGAKQANVLVDWTNGALAGAVGQTDIAAFGQQTIEKLRVGQMWIVNGSPGDPGPNESWEAGANIGAPLLQDGRWVAVLFVNDSSPRQWRPVEIELVREVAERTWAAVERARAEARLRKSEERFRKIFQHAATGIAITDLKGRFEQCNPAYCALLESTEEELQRIEFPTLVHPEDRDANLAELRRLLAGEVPSYEIVNRYVGKNGEPIWVDKFVSLLPGDDGKPGRILALVTDVTARRRAEEALRQSEEKYRSAFESMDEGFAICELLRDPNGHPIDIRLIELNPAFDRHAGISRQDALGRTMGDLSGGVVNPWWLETFTRVAETKTATHLERWDERYERWLDVKIFPAGGDRLAVLFEDVTDRKRLDAALHESEARHAFLLSLSDALRPTADPSEIQAVACRMLGEHLGLNRVRYADIEGDEFVVRQGWTKDVAPFTGRGPVAAFGQALVESYRRGETVVVNDVSADPRFTDSERAGLQAAEIGAFVGFMLTKSGRWVGALGAHSKTPRVWTDAEIDLFRDVAERIWAAAERAQAEAALRESEEKYRTLFETMEEGFAVGELIRDETGRAIDFVWLELNPRLERLTGLRREQLIGRRVSQAVPGLEDWWVSTYERIVDTAKPERFERYIEPIGRWLECAAFPYGGNRFAVLYDDITERKRTEAALRESEERFRLASEATGFGTFDYDALRRHGSFSSQLNRMLGLPGAGPIRNEDVPKLIHADDRTAFLKMKADSLDPAGPGHHDLEFRIVRPGGEVRWMREVGHTFFEGEGESRRAVRVVGMLLDVTDRAILRLQLEEALRRADDELRAIVQAAPLAIMTCDREGNITTWNTAAERIFGYEAEEAIGRFNPAIPGHEVPKYRDALKEVLELEKIHVAVGEQFRKDGSAIEVSMCCAPLHGQFGDVRGAVVLAEDVTEKKRAELELTRVRAALATAQEDEARRIARELHDDITQKLALLSVDMGRAAAALASQASLVQDFRAYQAQILAISESVRQISHRMHPSILDDLGLSSALEHLFGDFSRREGAPVSYRAEGVSDDLPRSVSTCLYRVAQEALHNISKYAPRSSVTARLAMAGGAVELCIIDSGAGFDPAAARLGLGLHSMRERVALVNGSFSIESEPGAGTRVVATLPLPG